MDLCNHKSEIVFNELIQHLGIVYLHVPWKVNLRKYVRNKKITSAHWVLNISDFSRDNDNHDYDICYNRIALPTYFTGNC